MVYGLIIANVAVFMLWQVADSKFMKDNFTVSWILNHMLLNDAILRFCLTHSCLVGHSVSELVGARNKHEGIPSIYIYIYIKSFMMM